MQAIASRDAAAAGDLLLQFPGLATAALQAGATRAATEENFLSAISHHIYASDTALHIAAAAHWPDMIARLVGLGADPAARNRRGATPLHYAADGNPAASRWDPEAQAATITLLIGMGADPTAVDKNGVSALHRAVRNRCAAAVRALLEGGADADRPNGKGSTPMMLATQQSGRGGSGSPEAKVQQAEICRLLGA